MALMASVAGRGGCENEKVRAPAPQQPEQPPTFAAARVNGVAGGGGRHALQVLVAQRSKQLVHASQCHLRCRSHCRPRRFCSCCHDPGAVVGVWSATTMWCRSRPARNRAPCVGTCLQRVSSACLAGSRPPSHLRLTPKTRENLTRLVCIHIHNLRNLPVSWLSLLGLSPVSRSPLDGWDSSPTTTIPTAGRAYCLRYRQDAACWACG